MARVNSGNGGISEQNVRYWAACTLYRGEGRLHTDVVPMAGQARQARCTLHTARRTQMGRRAGRRVARLVYTEQTRACCAAWTLDARVSGRHPASAAVPCLCTWPSRHGPAAPTPCRPSSPGKTEPADYLDLTSDQTPKDWDLGVPSSLVSNISLAGFENECRTPDPL